MTVMCAVVGLFTGIGVALAGLFLRHLRMRHRTGTVAERVTYDTLHRAWSAAPSLRAGLMPETAAKTARHLRGLLDTPALAIITDTGLLAWDGDAGHHAAAAAELGAKAFSAGTADVLGPEKSGCDELDCPARYAIAAPLTVEDAVEGVLVVYASVASRGLVQAVAAVARWASGQLELAELDHSKARLIEAEVRALRAQISPHFIYNSLTAIASFVRTDPDHARELLLEFADFTRYSFRRHGDFTTLAEELHSIDQYLMLERARFGDRLRVTLQVAPEVLPVAVPFLCLQPLVENAVQHGMERGSGQTHIQIVAKDAGAEAWISVEDDGAGMDPERIRRTLAGKPDPGTGIALGNIDERLRRVYGAEYGLVVETAVGAGTKVNVRVPKYRAGVHAS